ncbi:putative ACR [uncultured archaeon]|nr:putative ACR [uncultured archaeon]
MPASPFQARITNLASGQSASFLLEPACSMLSRMRGLMFRQKPAALLFTFDWTDKHSIHSFFVAYPFDAIYLDESGAVADVFASVPPFTPLLAPRSPVRYLLELPQGGAARLRARIGDRISIHARSSP